MKKLVYLLALGLSISACEKDKKDDNPAASGTPAAPTISVPGMDGLLVALNSSSSVEVPFIGTTTTTLGLAIAKFYENQDPSKGVNAGTVSVDTENLKYTSGTYIYEMSATNPTGLTFGSTQGWQIAGNGSVPAISETHNREVPVVADLTGLENGVDISGDFSFGINTSSLFSNISPADSILYLIIDNAGGVVQKTMHKSQTQVTFSKAELSGLAKGNGYAQAAAYNTVIRDYSGYKIAYINEGVNTKTVEIK